jgi:hypothetical protein
MKIILLIFLLTVTTAFAQTTEISYQGLLNDASMPATGNYDFEFRIFPLLTGGSQIGATNVRNAVGVTNGSFAVVLDFPSAWPGDDRWLEIRVRLAGGDSFTTLAPRQKITSVPYSLKTKVADTAINAITLGTIPAAGFVQTNDPRLTDARVPLPGSSDYIQPNDPRLTDARTPLPGSNDYIQNSTGFPVQSANISIGGFALIGGNALVAGTLTANGDITFGDDVTAAGTVTARTMNADLRYSLGGQRFLSTQSNDPDADEDVNNTFVGVGAGSGNYNGADNTYVGFNAGNAGVNIFHNSFFGSNAGRNNTGDLNSFFGSDAGNSNTSGDENSFFGREAGAFNTNGARNSYFGSEAGRLTATSGPIRPSNNSFFGFRSGDLNLTGERNSYFGSSATGFQHTSDNAYFGYLAGSGNRGEKNSIFGTYDGRVVYHDINFHSENSFFGYLSGVNGERNATFGNEAGIRGGITYGGNRNVFVGWRSGGFQVAGNNLTMIGANAQFTNTDLSYATAIGADSVVGSSNTIVLGRDSGADRVKVWGILEVNTLGAPGTVQLCRNVSGHIGNCLQTDGKQEAFLDQQQEISARQQLQIDQLQDQIKQQQSMIDALRTLVCKQDPLAEFCQNSR